jgi:hypothetical protein
VLQFLHDRFSKQSRNQEGRGVASRTSFVEVLPVLTQEAAKRRLQAALKTPQQTEAKGKEALGAN